ERVHDPASVTTRPLGPFLAQEPDGREPAREEAADAALGGRVGRRDGVLRRLQADAAHPAEVVVEDPARGQGGPDRGPGLRAQARRQEGSGHAWSGRLMAWKIRWSSSTSPRASSGVVTGRPPAWTQSAKWISSSLNASFIDAVTRFSKGRPSSIPSTIA